MTGSSVMWLAATVLLAAEGAHVRVSDVEAAVAKSTAAQRDNHLHPAVPLLDLEGQSVLKSGQPISTMKTCAGCHDTPYIAAHSYHASLGRDEITAAGKTASGRPWDWQESGAVEMNCFLCHVAQPDTDARRQELASGRFAWANTATLVRTGVVKRNAEGWAYQLDAFRPDGSVEAADLGLQEPKSHNCGLCHGVAETPGSPSA